VLAGRATEDSARLGGDIGARGSRSTRRDCSQCRRTAAASGPRSLAARYLGQWRIGRFPIRPVL